MDGKDVLEFLDMGREIWIDVLALTVIAVMCRVIGYLWLRIGMKPGRN